MAESVERSGEYFHWVIRQFDKRELERHIYSVCSPYSSPYFNFADVTWDLKIKIMNITSFGQTEYWIGLILTNFREPNPHYHVTLGLKAGEGAILRNAEPKMKGEQFTAKILNFCEITETGWEGLLPQGDLTVICKIVPKNTRGRRNGKGNDITEENLASKSFEKLLLDIEQMYLSGQNSDVVLRVDRQELRAHRCLLAARSPVFAAMFSHNLQENVSGVVTIEDIDLDTFSNFLHYLYTGRVQKTPENAPKLYVTADKYQVAELKEECLNFMINNITEETVCGFLNLAIAHHEQELIAAARNALSKLESQIKTSK